MFLPHPRVKVSIVGSLRDREVACSASDRQGSNFESCVWRTVSSQSSHHPQEVLLAQFSLYVHKGGLKPDSFHFPYIYEWHSDEWKNLCDPLDITFTFSRSLNCWTLLGRGLSISELLNAESLDERKRFLTSENIWVFPQQDLKTVCPLSAKAISYAELLIVLKKGFHTPDTGPDGVVHLHRDRIVACQSVSIMW